MANIIEKMSRAKTVEAIDTIIVNLTSPAALKPVQSVPENGNATVLNRL